MLIPNLDSLKDVGRVAGKLGDCQAFAARGQLKSSAGKVEATFDDNTAAIVVAEVENGRVVHFVFLPGISYRRSATNKTNRLPANFSEALRKWITLPIELAHVESPTVVDHSLVEAPLLVSETGAAVTLLNWTGSTIEELAVKVRVPFAVKSVRSIATGTLPFKVLDGSIRCTLPLNSADILVLKP